MLACSWRLPAIHEKRFLFFMYEISLIESFKVVSLFNYQGSVCFSLLLYSLAQLLYVITLPSVCQQLFLIYFFQSFDWSVLFFNSFDMLPFLSKDVNTFFKTFLIIFSGLLLTQNNPPQSLAVDCYNIIIQKNCQDKSPIFSIIFLNIISKYFFKFLNLFFQICTN